MIEEKGRQDWLCVTAVLYCGKLYYAGNIIRAEDLKEPGKPKKSYGKVVPLSDRHKYTGPHGNGDKEDRKLVLKEEYRGA